jgi:Cu(I)/Ag(I) efflux system protein CusF
VNSQQDPCAQAQLPTGYFPHTLQPQGKTMKIPQLFAAFVLTLSTAAMAALPEVDGEVRKIDLSAKKITIKHGEIKNLDMPPMTMVFQVKDPALLTKAKVGEKVQFTVEDANGAMTILTLEPVRK